MQLLLLLALLATMAWASPMTASLPNHAPITPEKRVLVLVDNADLKNSSSQYFDALGELGFKLRFRKMSESSTLVLKTNGEYDFDHCILMFSSAVNCHERSINNLLDFVDNGGNMLLASVGQSKFANDVAQECGVRISTAPVLDRFTGGSTFTVPWKESRVVGRAASGSSTVKYSGTMTEPSKEALELGAINALVGGITTLAKSENRFGSNIALVTSVQMKNNARVSVAGSVAVFSNEYGNLEFAKRLTMWTFAQASVLRVTHWQHGKQDGTSFVLQKSHESEMAHKHLPRSHFPDPEWGPNSKIYRIRDEVRYDLQLEVQGFDGKWTPYVADDVQVEFAMLDAYQRLNFKHLGEGKYQSEFMLPDQYGTFAFRVVYNRPGLSSIRLLDSVNVRPFSHNEYERFIPNAFPYYMAVFVVMVGFLLFSCAFAYTPKQHSKLD